MLKIHNAMHGREAKAVPETQGRLIRWAGRYDLLMGVLRLGHNGGFRHSIARRAGIASGDRVLDVGCGTGDLTLAAKRLAGPAGEVAGIDAAGEMIAVARQKAARQGVAVDFQVGLIQHLPFPDGYFDVVLSSLMLHHLPGDLKARGLAEVLRVLRPGGRLLVLDFRATGPGFVHHLLALMLHHAPPNAGGGLPALLTGAGFTKISSETVGLGALECVRGVKRAT